MIGFIRRLLSGEQLPEPALTPPGFNGPKLPEVDVDEASAPAPPQIDEPLLEPLNGRALVIDYLDTAGSESQRRIVAKVCFQANDRLYLSAYCLERQAPRTFRVDRIEAVFCGVTGEDLGQPEALLTATEIRENFGTAPRRPPLSYPEIRKALRVLNAIARCDGELHSAEQHVMSTFVSRVLPHVSEQERLELVDYALKLSPSYRVFMDCIGPSFEDEKLGNALIETVGDLVNADGKYTVEEANLVDDLIAIGRACGFSIAIEPVQLT